MVQCIAPMVHTLARSRPHAMDAQSWSDQQSCRETVHRLIDQHNWQLLDPDEFTRRTYEHLRAGVATDPGRAAIYTYSQALYTACSGAEGPQRQNLSYAELFRYLYDSALRRYPDVCDEATQNALEHTFTTFGRCRNAGTFFAFALQNLADAARALRRQEERRPQSLATLVGTGDDTLEQLLPDSAEMDPSTQVVARERQASLGNLVTDFLRKHPRAAQQLAALWWKYVEGLDEATISFNLGKSVKSTYVLRSRMVARLQCEPAWRLLAVDYGILPLE